MENIQSVLESVQEFYLKYPEKLEQMKLDYQNVCMERQDLLHALEFGSLNGPQLTKLSIELKNVQQKRRQLKNEIEVFEQVVKLVKSPQKPNKQRINNLIGNVRSTIKNQGYRTYHMRIRKDLQDVIK